jgi:probable rRNA maturation factor
MTKTEVAIACVAPPTECLDQDALKTTLQAVLSDQGAGGLVTLILTDDTTLCRLNRDFRGIDAPTDVISFDLKDPVHPAGGEIGEIYISLDRARVQARGAHRPLQEEITHLAIHGVLHLLGYTHNTHAAHASMQRQEARYLARVTR